MRDKIFAICDDLQRQNIKPTLEKVRAALGGGSFSTINPLLREWKSQQDSVICNAQDLPDEALQAMNRTASLIWSLATAQSADAMRTLKADFESRLSDAAAERDEALQEVARLEQEIAKREQESAKMNALARKREKEISSLTLQVDKQQLALDQAIMQNSELKADLNALKVELKNASSDAAMLRGQVIAYQAQAKVTQ